MEFPEFDNILYIIMCLSGREGGEYHHMLEKNVGKKCWKKTHSFKGLYPTLSPKSWCSSHYKNMHMWNV